MDASSPHGSPGCLRVRLCKLVAGGQTGVDQAALMAAEQIGLATGGWCPTDVSDETWPVPDLFARWKLVPVTEDVRESHQAEFRAIGLQFDDQDKWARRGLLNVLCSCGTLTILPHGVSDGTNLASAAAKALGRPMLTLRLQDAHTDSQALVQWFQEHAIEVLNVNGPRESSSQGIGAVCLPLFKQWLSAALQEGQVNAGHGG